MARPGSDVIVVGAGLAGAAASLQLAAAGLDVTVLEARPRVGGRGYVRSFGKDGDSLDFGGSWITPWQHRIRQLCAEHGVRLRPRHPIVERRWLRDGTLHLDGPVSASDAARHLQVLERLAADSARYKSGQTTGSGGHPFEGVSLESYLARLDPPEATRDLISAWWTVSGNADKSISPATELLGSLAYWDGTPDGIAEVWAHTLEGGVSRLVERMLWQAGVDLRLDTPVTEVVRNDTGVEIVTRDAGRLVARAALLATGLAPLAGIRFSPTLGNAKSHAIGVGHAGRAVKIWAKAAGVAVGVLVTGGGRGIEWMFSERQAADGRTLIVGFGVADDAWTPSLPSDGVAAVGRFFPEAREIEIDWHDWIADPFARGTWVAGIVGEAAAHRYSTWRREGSLAFASSDVAPEAAGWFEASILSGEAAARELVSALGLVGSEK
ncbi:MAG: NAD(P)/FAD-dependent oxidoreductase [Hyphomicrobiaceae bacterium]